MDEARLGESVRELHRVMRRLRKECPWDARQDHDSLRRFLIEECHEALDALDRHDAEALRSELGDLLFQVWFHAEVASERPAAAGGFDLADVLDGVARKLVARHPHVFGGEPAGDLRELKRAWEKRKLAEGRKSRLEGIPPLSPALLASQLLQEKAAGAGFDWPDLGGVLDKVREEFEELAAELPEAGGAGGPVEAGGQTGPAPGGAPRPTPEQVHELGDLLFSLVNLSRRLGITAEDALREANARFRRRFAAMEEKARAAGREIDSMTLEEMDALWNEVKRGG